MRAHRCPPGFIGRPQNRQVGRPASMRPRARSTNAATWARVRRTRPDARSLSGGPALLLGLGLRLRLGGRLLFLLLLRLLGLLRLVLLPDLFDHQHHAVRRLVVADADRPHDPGRRRRLDQREVRASGRRRRRQTLEEPAQVLAKDAHLLLLALERHQRIAFPGLEIEDALAGRADRAGGEEVRRGEVERLAHRHAPPPPNPPPRRPGGGGPEARCVCLPLIDTPRHGSWIRPSTGGRGAVPACADSRLIGTPRLVTPTGLDGASHHDPARGARSPLVALTARTVGPDGP